MQNAVINKIGYVISIVNVYVGFNEIVRSFHRKKSISCNENL